MLQAKTHCMAEFHRNMATKTIPSPGTRAMLQAKTHCMADSRSDMA